MNIMDNQIPLKELRARWQRCRDLLGEFLPEAEGAFIFSRLNIYYFTGTFANGIFYLPREGEPILLCRRGAERAKLETSLTNIFKLHSYRDIEPLFKAAGLTVPAKTAAEMNGLSWGLAKSLTRNLAAVDFVPADKLVAMTRAKKSAWELLILRQAGAKHHACLTELLPPLLHEGISELEIAHKLSALLYSEGHLGVLRMESFGEEAFLGHIAIGDSANYPSVFNGPVGLVGAHPSAPFMGSENIRWSPNSLLTIDIGFTLAGYHTDKTQVYWLGAQSDIPDSLQDAHGFCVDMQAMVAEKLRPGAIPAQIWDQCRELAAHSPWEAGFMGLQPNKVGFVGHGIGLAIDEYPVLAKGFDVPLEEGMVLAVEPKIGIGGIGMVGVENTFEVTAGGGQPITGLHDEIIAIEGDLPTI